MICSQKRKQALFTQLTKMPNQTGSSNNTWYLVCLERMGMRVGDEKPLIHVFLSQSPTKSHSNGNFPSLPIPTSSPSLCICLHFDSIFFSGIIQPCPPLFASSQQISSRLILIMASKSQLTPSSSNLLCVNMCASGSKMPILAISTSVWCLSFLAVRYCAGVFSECACLQYDRLVSWSGSFSR